MSRRSKPWRGEMPWFKHFASSLTDPELRRLTAAQRGVFWDLRSQAASHGTLPLDLWPDIRRYGGRQRDVATLEEYFPVDPRQGRRFDPTLEPERGKLIGFRNDKAGDGGKNDTTLSEEGPTLSEEGPTLSEEGPTLQDTQPPSIAGHQTQHSTKATTYSDTLSDFAESPADRLGKETSGNGSSTTKPQFTRPPANSEQQPSASGGGAVTRAPTPPLAEPGSLPGTAAPPPRTLEERKRAWREAAAEDAARRAAAAGGDMIP